jgi:proteasome lid subunit RPN8/RPN11
VLPAQFIEAMFAQAQAEGPNECCGLLAGRVADGLGRVVQRYPLRNAAASPVEFVSEAQDMFAAVRDMHRRGLDILAVYHSHPASPAVPSRKDRERNYSPEIVNLIISLQGATPTLRGWWLTADTATEAQWEAEERPVGRPPSSADGRGTPTV